MFSRLKRRLLIMNLTMMSVLMLLSFGTIYIVTSNNVHDNVERELYRVSDMSENDVGRRWNFGDISSFFTQGEQDKPPKDDENDMNKQEYFSIALDEEGNISEIKSFVEREESFYEEMIIRLKGIDSKTGEVSLEGRDWAYLLYESRGCLTYYFLDMTAEQDVLDRLILTFVIVSVLTFFAILLVSNILTNSSIKPIRKAFDQQKRFIADASHELKTPLSVIRTNVEVLQSGDKDREDEKWLAYIKSEVERMSKLTNDLLYLTQVEEETSTMGKVKEFPINDSLESMLLGLEALCYEKKIQLDYELDSDIYFKGNKEQFIQLVLILLDNGIKYTPVGGRIFLSLKKKNHQLKLKVNNTGLGIDEEDLPYIFDRFYRGDKARSRKEDNYGLGLAIAKAIVEQHKGKIYCESTIGQETTFTVSLPM